MFTVTHLADDHHRQALMWMADETKFVQQNLLNPLSLHKVVRTTDKYTLIETV